MINRNPSETLEADVLQSIDEFCDAETGGAFKQILLQQLERRELDPSMILSDQETQWALELKQAVTSSNGEAPVFNDMDYAQHAIVASGDIQEALARVRGMQLFHKKHGIDHSCKQIIFYLKGFLRQYPGCLLHLDNDPLSLESVLVFETTCLGGLSALSQWENKGGTTGPGYSWKVCVVGLYYLLYLLQPSFSSSRKGLLLAVDCQNDDWDDSTKQFGQCMLQELLLFLPVNCRGVMVFNTSTVANLMISTYKPFLPRNIRENVFMMMGSELQKGFNGGTTTSLRELYGQPSLAETEERALRRAVTLKALRSCNEKVFQLDACFTSS
ncbi:unknown protein [Seminavis robusta]|uniref:CRAL-TRIO domain-containing protein n=1 Tax=Seminavis robusta TaxID=568900 RepID=A0A9N8HSU8_9STRA|nr:unknown protein [Seminavis robusta]|eukprot:Sro1431_g272010.1 n/a (328) ;mRNA; f:12657-13640